MKNIQLFILTAMMIFSFCACAQIAGQSPTVSAATAILVTPMNQAGIVNADAVPVRKGPGVEFDQAALIYHDYSITVIGQSADGAWYQVQVPGYNGSQSSLWIAIDFVTIVASTNVASTPSVEFTATIGPTTVSTEMLTTGISIPSETQPSAFQSTVSACGMHTGWVMYIVQPGDNLFRLSVKTGTTVEQIMAANCLTANQITVGMQLYLPFIPPTNTLISLAIPTPTFTPILIASPTETTSATPAPSPTPTITLHPLNTLTDTSTAVVSPVAPTLGTPNQ